MSKISKSERTKRKILQSAETLFKEKGYNNVTVREIAANAKVSHTTIYLYYRDKEQLLNEIAVLPLLDFRKVVVETFEELGQEPRQLIKEMGKKLVHFGITNRTMYDIYFNQGSVNVQMKEPSLEVNQIRNELFEYITKSFALLYPLKSREDITTYARMFYFFSNGLITSYVNNTEETNDILERINPVLEEMYGIILSGIEHYGNEEDHDGKTK